MESNEIKLILALFGFEHVVGVIIYFLFGLKIAVITGIIIIVIGLAVPIILVKYVTRPDGYLIREITRRINE